MESSVIVKRKLKAYYIVMTILRVAIGWHLLYEGLTKLLNPQWSASGFLESATGPFSGLFQFLAAGDIRPEEAFQYYNFQGRNRPWRA